MSKIKGYIFDMDGVLCDSEPFIAAAAIRMFKERYGTDVTTEDFKPFVGTGEDRFLAARGAGGRGRIRRFLDATGFFDCSIEATGPGRLPFLFRRTGARGSEEPIRCAI